MGNKVNKYGLTRYIDADTTRRVRQECGFGCVICGDGFYDYEHVDPLFEDALEHDAAAIALLCGSHHARVTRGMLSKETVKSARAAPYCRSIGSPWIDMDIPSGEMRVSMGGTIFSNPRSVLVMYGKEILRVDAPEEPGAPLRITGCFYDCSNRLMVEIIENRIIICEGSWDVVLTGSRIVVRRGPRDVMLDFRILPNSGIHVDKLNMSYRGATVTCERGALSVVRPDGGGAHFGSGNLFLASDCCIDVERNVVSISERVAPMDALGPINIYGFKIPLFVFTRSEWIGWLSTLKR